MPAIKHYLLIKTPAEKVYTALSKTEGLCGWWTTGAKTGEHIGGTAEFIFGERYYNKMKITNLLNNKKVEWDCLEGDKEWIGTTFLFDLEEKDGSTILRFSHNNWKEETDFFASCNFNWGYYLNSLKQFCESGEGTPFKNG
jgi:uncharacterized protein YndB with AHSA1/START domain